MPFYYIALCYCIPNLFILFISSKDFVIPYLYHSIVKHCYGSFVFFHCSPFYSVLLCVWPCIILHCIVLYYFALHCIILFCIALYYIILHYILFYYIALHCIALYCIVLCFIIISCTVFVMLYIITLHCMVLCTLPFILILGNFLYCAVVYCMLYRTALFAILSCIALLFTYEIQLPYPASLCPIVKPPSLLRH